MNRKDYDKGYEDGVDSGQEGTTFMIGAAVALLVIMVISPLLSYEPEMQELGNAICDQEYNLEFDSYTDGELSCKPKEVKLEIPYDGIKVLIKDE